MPLAPLTLFPPFLGGAECTVTMFLAASTGWNFASSLEVTGFLTGTVAGEADCLGVQNHPELGQRA